MTFHKDFLDQPLSVGDIVAACRRYSETNDLQLYEIKSIKPKKIKVIMVRRVPQTGKIEPTDPPPDLSNPYYSKYPEKYRNAMDTYDRTMMDGNYLLTPEQTVKIVL